MNDISAAITEYLESTTISAAMTDLSPAFSPLLEELAKKFGGESTMSDGWQYLFLISQFNPTAAEYINTLMGAIAQHLWEQELGELDFSDMRE